VTVCCVHLGHRGLHPPPARRVQGGGRLLRALYVVAARSVTATTWPMHSAVRRQPAGPRRPRGTGQSWRQALRTLEDLAHPALADVAARLDRLAGRVPAPSASLVAECPAATSPVRDPTGGKPIGRHAVHRLRSTFTHRLLGDLSLRC